MRDRRKPEAAACRHRRVTTQQSRIPNPSRYNPGAMPRRKAPEELSVEELRRLLIEKRRGTRRERLEHFRRTGRVVAPELTEAPSPAPVVDTPEPEAGDRRVAPASPRRRFMDGMLLAVEILA